MSTRETRSEPPAAEATGVWSRQMMLLLATTFGVFSSFYLLLSVVPQFAAANGAAEALAGATTGVYMFATVGLQVFMPRLLVRFGYRTLLLSGAVLLGAPALLLIASSRIDVVLAVSAVRGLGFGIVTVACAALVAELVPPRLRGKGSGLYGGAVGLAGLGALPLGVWMAEHLGYETVFLTAGLVPLVSLFAAIGLAAPRPVRGQEAGGLLRAFRTGALRRPFLVLTMTAVASGTVVTFLPLAVTGAGAALVPAALLAQQAFATGGRWAAGLLGDRFGNGRLLVPAVVSAGAGVGAVVLGDQPVVLLTGMVLFGLGFGVVQNATLVIMFQRVERRNYGLASTQWNIGFDAGTGLGAVAIGLVVQQAGYGAGFMVVALLVLAVLPAAWPDRAAR
ncbi:MULTISPECIES: MFS transporter [Actinoalloteichus]|nr:MFS transporter [Actinoalloteichus caeruleus]